MPRLTTKLTPELSCTDITASLKFYVEALGFSIQYQRPTEGFAMLEREGSRLMLDQITPPDATSETARTWLTGVMEYPFGRGINLQIETTNIDALYVKAQEKGARIFLSMEEKWYRADAVELGNRQFIAQDPDGYLLRFFQDLGERPAR